jgi:N-acetylmuramoyl-L-alanine amidase
VIPLKICLDPGQGGRDRYNKGPTGYIEADGTLSIALQCRKILIMAGLEVIMTRGDDIDLCPFPVYDQASDLKARAEFANQEKADYFVSIHTNAANQPAAHGTETHIYPKSVRGRALAERIQNETTLVLGTADRGIKESDFAVLRLTDMPAVLIEVAFHTNPAEEALLKNPAFLRKAGEAIAIGIIKHLGLPQPPIRPELEENDVEEILESLQSKIKILENKLARIGAIIKE